MVLGVCLGSVRRFVGKALACAERSEASCFGNPSFICYEFLASLRSARVKTRENKRRLKPTPQTARNLRVKNPHSRPIQPTHSLIRNEII